MIINNFSVFVFLCLPASQAAVIHLAVNLQNKFLGYSLLTMFSFRKHKYTKLNLANIFHV